MNLIKPDKFSNSGQQTASILIRAMNINSHSHSLRSPRSLFSPKIEPCSFSFRQKRFPILCDSHEKDEKLDLLFFLFSNSSIFDKTSFLPESPRFLCVTPIQFGVNRSNRGDDKVPGRRGGVARPFRLIKPSPLLMKFPAMFVRIDDEDDDGN